jgi:ATP-dependent helicase Lhr and Lhr-like helicase
VGSQQTLDIFHPIVRQWFERTYAEPSPPQVLGWPSIAAGHNTLILAPTGSGKTLTAFLWAINHVVEQRIHEEPFAGVRILYVSPLKALNNDIERNLEAPLQGIHQEAHEQGLRFSPIRTAVRTGDTPQARRAAMIKHPPDILITTPESLYLMLTSREARKIFSTVQYLIIDEIHSLCSNKRGVHLSISMERLQVLAEQEFVRIGLSATQKPLEEIAAFLGGNRWHGERKSRALRPRPVTIINAGQKRLMDLRVACPVPDFSLLPQDSVWPMVFGELLHLIQAHRTTLVFVNNRRLAERVAAKLNEMLSGEDNSGTAAGRDFNLYAVPVRTGREHTPEKPRIPEEEVRAYHGSMSRQAREEMESALKAGQLRALIATSSLELGIDIGSIDLVVQLQSPKGIARGLQRVGRSGHLVTATSKGRIFPTHREDLVEAAVIAREMLNHEVERTVIPRNCLDVLAQHIVAMVSVDEWDVDALFDLLRQSACYTDLSRDLYANVLSMLAGRYTNEAFRELQPRISWDKVNNTLRPLPGSSRLALTSGGTIADRGAFGVYLEDGKTKVGEVDEEFVFETRTGDAFILGTNVWRVTSIDANRLTVVAAPGQPARMPFWRGEGIGRSVELGMSIGSFRRDVAARLEHGECSAWLQQEFPIDRDAAWNIEEYFRRQQAVTGVVPHDRLLLVEGFRDEIGDPRIVVHCALGRRVNGLLGLVLSRRLHERVGAEPQMFYNDDGVLLRCPDADTLPLDLLEGMTIDEARRIVLDDILQSPLFGGQFRQNAARALLMPRRAPGARTPLWLQRLRAKDLLQIARQFDDFPIVIETMREVLHDLLDLQNFTWLIGSIQNGTVEVRTVQTETPSPFSASLLFDFIAVYMYEWDQPRADTLSRYLAVNRELLSEIVDIETVGGLLRPEAIEAVEQQLQHTTEGTRARSPEELMELLLRLGDLSDEEIIARCVGDARSMIETLARDGRAQLQELPDGPRWIAGEESEVYTNLAVEANARRVVLRHIQSHGPVSSRILARRYGLDESRVKHIAAHLPPESKVVSGRFRGGFDEPELCYRPTLERIHRQTLTILRREITPCSLVDFSKFLLHWQHIDPATRLTGTAGVEECLVQMQGTVLPTELWERDVLAQRVADYATTQANQVCSTGSIVWIGQGPARMTPAVRGETGAFVQTPDPSSLTGLGEPARRILDYLQSQGASFLNDIRGATGLSLAALNSGFADLFWNGLVTNDVLSEILAIKGTAHLPIDTPMERTQLASLPRPQTQRKLLSRVRRSIRSVPGWNGRWSFTAQKGITGPELTLEERALRQSVQLLDRYGVVAREFHRREELLPWTLIAAEFQRMEMQGEIRRGYFVKGLSGMQYALPSAVEELRRMRSSPVERPAVILLNTCDPANPLGANISPELRKSELGEIRITRLPGNFLAFKAGAPVLYIENYGTRFWSVSEPDMETIREAIALLLQRIAHSSGKGRIKDAVVEYFNGERPAGTAVETVLRSLGFYREMNQTMRWDLT